VERNTQPNNQITWANKILETAWPVTEWTWPTSNRAWRGRRRWARCPWRAGWTRHRTWRRCRVRRAMPAPSRWRRRRWRNARRGRRRVGTRWRRAGDSAAYTARKSTTQVRCWLIARSRSDVQGATPSARSAPPPDPWMDGKRGAKLNWKAGDSRREQHVWGASVGKRSERPMEAWLTLLDEARQAGKARRVAVKEQNRPSFKPSRWRKKRIYSCHTQLLRKR